MGLVFLSPILFLFEKSKAIPKDATSNWVFVVDKMLPELSANSFFLVIGTISLSVLISISLVILIRPFSLRIRKFLVAILSLPLIFPIYVFSFVYLGMFEWAAPFPTFFREYFSLSTPSIKTIPGAIFVFSIALYPYVFIPLEIKVNKAWENLFIVSKNLGASTPKTVFLILRVIGIKPILFGAVVIGLEVLSDFGGASILGIDTYTTAIYTAWSSFFSIEIATRLGLILLVPAFLILFFENILEYFFKGKTTEEEILNNKKLIFSRIFYLTSCSIIFFFTILSLILPIFHLIKWAFVALVNGDVFNVLFELTTTSLILGILVPVFILVMALKITIILKWVNLRIRNGSGNNLFVNIFCQYGYGIPGNLLAVGILVFSSYLNSYFTSSFSYHLALMFLVFGLMVKFSRIAFKNFSLGEKAFSINTERSALILNGNNFGKYIVDIYFPGIKKYFIGSFFILGVEVFKELPITLFLRPIGVNTLSTKVYEYASEGEWEQCALFTLPILLLGCALKLFLDRKQKAFA